MSFSPRASSCRITMISVWEVEPWCPMVQILLLFGFMQTQFNRCRIRVSQIDDSIRLPFVRLHCKASSALGWKGIFLPANWRRISWFLDFWTVLLLPPIEPSAANYAHESALSASIWESTFLWCGWRQVTFHNEDFWLQVLLFYKWVFSL